MTSDPHLNQPVFTSGHKLAGAPGAVILVHGRGASAEDILGLGAEFDHPELAYFAPQAAGHSWYPYSFLAPIEQNEPWLTSALNKLGKTVENIVHEGIRRENIIVAGFSQGACLASEFVARNAAKYGGLIAFSGGLIGPPGTQFRYSAKLYGTPAFLGSGDADAHIPWQRVEESASVLEGLGAEVVLRRYQGMPHTINQDEIDEARKLIARALSQAASSAPSTASAP